MSQFVLYVYIHIIVGGKCALTNRFQMYVWDAWIYTSTLLAEKKDCFASLLSAKGYVKME